MAAKKFYLSSFVLWKNFIAVCLFPIQLQLLLLPRVPCIQPLLYYVCPKKYPPFVFVFFWQPTNQHFISYCIVSFDLFKPFFVVLVVVSPFIYFAFVFVSVFWQNNICKCENNCFLGSGEVKSFLRRQHFYCVLIRPNSRPAILSTDSSLLCWHLHMIYLVVVVFICEVNFIMLHNDINLREFVCLKGRHYWGRMIDNFVCLFCINALWRNLCQVLTHFLNNLHQRWNLIWNTYYNKYEILV